MVKFVLWFPIMIVNQKNMDKNSWAKHSFKSQKLEFLQVFFFFYNFRTFEIITEIDLG